MEPNDINIHLYPYLSMDIHNQIFGSRSCKNPYKSDLIQERYEMHTACDDINKVENDFSNVICKYLKVRLLIYFEKKLEKCCKGVFLLTLI